MEESFIYWRHKTPVGVKVEEVSGGDGKSGKVWLQLARQVYSENGQYGYREIGHYENGAPYLTDDDCRISVSHTAGLLVVATLPKTPEVRLDEFNIRTAMGVDAERSDRQQVMKVREKFLSEEERSLVGEDLSSNILAWTLKEAMYKAAFQTGMDFKKDIKIVSLPDIASSQTGKGIIMRQGESIEMILYSYESEGCVVSIALSGKCATYKKTVKG